MKRTGMPGRSTELARGTRLERGAELERRTRIRKVSAKRQAQNRERRTVVAALWPGGPPQCEWPGCMQLADDVHERLSRARGGSITDPDNLCPLCRTHHDKVTFTPESELAEAYELDLLRHSWDAPRIGDAA